MSIMTDVPVSDITDFVGKAFNLETCIKIRKRAQKLGFQITVKPVDRYYILESITAKPPLIYTKVSLFCSP